MVSTPPAALAVSVLELHLTVLTYLTYLTRPLDNRPQDVSGGPLQYWTNEGKERDRKTDRQPDRQTDRDS